MKFLEIKENLNILPSTFNLFDGGFFIYDKDFLNTEETDKKLIVEDVFNFSFDGSFLYINDLAKGEEFLKHIKKHLKRHLKDLKEEDNYDFEDDGFSNAFFYKKLNTGILVMDAKTEDFGSIIENILEDFKYKKDLKIYSDCHLVDNIRLGRNNKEYNEFYKFLFDSNVINCEFIFQTNIKINSDIIITGEFDLPNQKIKDILKSFNNIKIKHKPESSKDWIWCGSNPDEDILNLAKKYNSRISNFPDFINILYSCYDQDKNCIEILDILKL